MSKKNEIDQEKKRILEILNEVRQYMTPAEIQERIEPKLKSHVLRSRLGELIEDGLVARQGVKRGTKYKVVTKHVGTVQTTMPRVQVNGTGVVTPPLSEAAKKVQKYVNEPLTSREHTAYNRDFLDRYQPNRSSYLTDAEKETLAKLGKAVDDQQPAGTYARKILHRLLIDLSFNSSRLEGNTYSLLDTERLIADGTPAVGKDPQETQMILNHKAAIEFLAEPSDVIGVNRHTVTNLHALLSENLLGNPAAEGRIRAIPVDIGQSVYVPTAIPQLIEECFELILNKATQIENPFEQALFLLVHLPYLQPFEDVNKRVSRLAANIPLFRQNLCPLSFTEVSKEQYIEGLLGVYELNDITLFKETFLMAYRRSASRYKVIQESLGAPDPVQLKHRDLIKSVVKQLVENQIDKATAPSKIDELISSKIDESEKSEVKNAIERELTSLHEGNIVKFKLPLSAFRSWIKKWGKAQ